MGAVLAGLWVVLGSGVWIGSGWGAEKAGETGEAGNGKGKETMVVRTVMPDSYPGSFAVVFPEGPSLCFDPVRGGINYIWEGTFLDLQPARTGKVPRPAGVGERFYKETGERPLRAGEAEGVQPFRFEGYEIREGYPVFFYEVGGHAVREELQPLPGGAGVVRRFATGAPGQVFWLRMEEQDGSVVTTPAGEMEEGYLRLEADEEGAFSITIRRER